MEDKAVDTDLELLVRDIETIRKVNTESDWDKVNWERIDGGIETLKKMRKLKEKVVNYVAPTQRPRESELRGGGAAWETQSENQPFTAAVNRAKEELSFVEKRARDKGRQSDLRESDQKVERNTEDVLKIFTQKMKDLKEMIAGGRNQEEIERVKVLGPVLGKDWKVRDAAELPEAMDQVLQQRSLDGDQPRKDVPREPVRTGTPGNRATPETPGKLQKPTSNVPSPQRGKFYQAPLRPQPPKDQHHSKAPGHQLPVPVNQVQPKSPDHQHPVSVIRTPTKAQTIRTKSI